MNVQFRHEQRGGPLMPYCCGKRVRFGIFTCRCAGGCNQQYNTLELDALTMQVNGLRPTPVIQQMAEILATGLLQGSPFDAPMTKEKAEWPTVGARWSMPESHPVAELAAEKLAKQTLAKAMAK